MVKIYIGPNGYGKTTKLINEKDDLIKSGIPEKDILFLESEILLMDEVKDTKDESKTLEFIIQELFMNSSNYVNAKNSFENQIDQEIINNQALMNSILDDVLQINKSARTPGKDFICKNPKIAFKNLVKIDNADIKNKIGSGQRMQLILSIVKNSNSKKYIFMDEPEKYSHPSLLHLTAKMIRELDNQGKSIFIATHSPKLLSMLDLSFNNLFVINDSSHLPKKIDFEEILNSFSFKTLNQMGKKEQSFYNHTSLENNIKCIYYRNFIECLFAAKVYLCEGINDSLFIQRALKSENLFFDDYAIFQSYGKFLMPVFEKIFSSLGISTQVFFDEDSGKRIKNSPHDEVDTYLETLSHYKFVPDIESEIGFVGKKYDSVSFIAYLDSFAFRKGKYIK